MDYNNYQNGYQQPWGNQPYAQTGTSNEWQTAQHWWR